MAANLQLYTTVLIATVVPIGLFLLFRRRNHQRSINSNTKLPPVLPLGWIATTWQISSNAAPWFLLTWAKQIGFVFCIRIPYPVPVIVVGETKLAREILNDPLTTKPYTFYGTIDIAAGASNVFTANGERWRHARKATALAFSSSHIQRMNQICRAKLDDWIKRRLNVFCETNQTFDPAQEMLLLTLSIISEAALEYEMTPSEAEVFVQDARLASKEYVLKQGNNPIRATSLGYLFAYTEIREAEQATRNIQAIVLKILKSYRTQRESPNKSLEGTVIERIVDNPNYKNDKERIADMIVFLVAGYDTTGYSIAWTLLEMARHAKEVTKARGELRLLSSDYERLKSPALDHLIKEAMRLHPVAALGAIRETHRDFRVDDATIIPKGSVVFTPIFLLHRNPEYFDQPDEFLPDRWSTTTNIGRNAQGAFMPFVTGPHNCLGQALATEEMRTILGHLLMNFDFEVVDEGKPDFELTMFPSGARLKARKL
jgi:cytochrome P450